MLALEVLTLLEYLLLDVINKSRMTYGCGSV